MPSRVRARPRRPARAGGGDGRSAPKTARIASSCSITPASRRTPSRIRSGGGKRVVQPHVAACRCRRRRSRCRARRRPARRWPAAASPSSPGPRAASPRRRSRRSGVVQVVPGGHQVGQRVEHRVPALPVDLAEDLDLLAPRHGATGTAATARLGERARAEDLRLAGACTSLSRTACGARTQPTRSPGAKVLENVLEVDDAVAAAGPQRPAAPRRRSRAARTGCPRRPAARRARRCRAPRRAGVVGQRHAGRVLVGRDRVEELGPPAGARPARRWPASSAAGISPSSSIATCTTCAWAAWNMPSAPTYVGPSASTTSPGSRKSRATRSSACCEPTVTTTSSGEAPHARRCRERHHLADPLAQLEGRPGRCRTAGWWRRARRPSRPSISPTASSGSAAMYGDAAGERHDLGPAGHGEQSSDLGGGHARGPAARTGRCSRRASCRS